MADEIQGKYVYVWEKYRPVLLKMMIAAEEGVESYSLSRHEFQDLNLKKTTGYSFLLKIFQNKLANDIKKNLLAQDLLYVLQHSNKAKELTELHTYQFQMDKDFVLQISIESEPKTEEPNWVHFQLG